MSRRTLSGVIAAALLLVLVLVASLFPVPYVTYSPGPTVDVLAEVQGEEIVTVAGEETFRDDGEIRLTTVSVTGPDQDIGLIEALSAWIDPDRAVYPRASVYEEDVSVEDVRQESSVQMVSSQDTAIAIALQELGFETPASIEVFAVSEGGPSDGVIEVRDKIVSVNGRDIETSTDVSEAVQETGVGEEAEFVVRRDDEERTLQVTAEASPDDPDTAVVGIVIGPGYDFPFDVTVRIDDNIGGPSAGLMFSLAIYDTLTEGSLTGGSPIAGTGTLDEEGNVGAIGGIQQKIAGAEAAGAELFLVPAGNCAEAVEAPAAEDLRLVRADTMSDALAAVQDWAEDPDAELPECAA